jgi:DNA polymerase family B
MRECIGCGSALPMGASLKTKRCKKDCGRNTSHKARTESRERHDMRFIGVDGEGVTWCGKCKAIKGDAITCETCGALEWHHDYVLLTVGTYEPLFNADGSHLYWADIFQYLYDCFTKDTSAAYVGFFLGYDFTQWLKTIPKQRAESLLTSKGIAKRARKNSGANKRPFPVHIGDEDNPWAWEIDTLAMKRFSLRPGTGLPPGTVKNSSRAMIICDTGAFFQKRFIDVIQSHVGTLITQEEFNTILEGKTRRSVARLDEDMKRYNSLENDILSRVMGQLNRGFSDVGIKLRADQWFGPGQAAQRWLNNISAPTSIEVYETIPEYAAETAQKTYYGGWFEIFRHGIIPGETYEYDINSAYPYAIANLPCLLHGNWNKGTSMVSGGTSLRMLHGHVRGSNRRLGTLPHRTPKGAIMRPYETRGWYWEHEIIAGIAAGIIDTVEVDEYAEYVPCDCPKPFRSIAELYQKRLQVGKNTPSGMAYKLVYNSSYGKMAQSVGKPKYANSVYASLITAACRTMILEAIASHPRGTEAVLMVATDGVYFDSPHPGLELDGERLGAWDESVKENMCLFMPGVYWDDKSRKALREGKEVKVKSRGVSARDLSLCISAIDDQFNNMGDGGEWPRIDIPINFNMTSAKLALARGKWYTAGNVIFDGVKALSSNPQSKRDPQVFRENGILTSKPYQRGAQLDTTPYDKMFAQVSHELDGWEITPDGTVQLDLVGMLNG